jgi:hypothetical protein
MTRAGQAGIPGERRARKIEGQFVPRLAEMIESAAYRVLSLSAHRCLSRIEVEHLHHGGRENGQLPITYDQFKEYGVHRHAIGPALRELEALGFVEITERGVAGNADQCAPNKFRLTYLPAGRAKPAHEWRRINSREEAALVAKRARAAEPREKWRVQKQKPVPVSANSQCGKSSPKAPNNTSRMRNSPVPETGTTSISLRGRRGRKLRWSTPQLVEVFPGATSIAHLKSLYRRQADSAGRVDDVWLAPPSPLRRIVGVGI